MNHYYTSSMVRTQLDDLGDYDNIFHHSFRMTVAGFQNPSQFEKNESAMYSLINPDDHDRVLVDPKYRIDRHMEAERVGKTLAEVAEKAKKGFDLTVGVDKVLLSRMQYENLVHAELAIREFDKFNQKAQRFNFRAFFDPANHDRREARMIERAQARKEQVNAVFAKGYSEEELQFEDYFETDLETESKSVIANEIQAEKERILFAPEMQ